MRKCLGPGLLLAIGLTLLYSCRKDVANEQFNPIAVPPSKASLGTTVSINITGFVTDENSHPVSGANVVAGGVTVATDSFGYFSIKNAVVPQIAGSVKVIYPGYFTGYKTFICTSSKSMFTRVKLMPKVNVGTVVASTGGTVTNVNGGIVTLPGNSAVVAVSNTAYSGNIHVAMHFIDPTNIDVVTLNMPGDLRGIDSANNIQGLNSYGMLAVELTGDGGQLLQIASGKQATLSFPIPSSLLASAPGSIPLWSFNDTTRLWQEEGVAIKVGNNYVGNVAHFSYWNCDIPFGAGITFETQFVDSALHPLANVNIEVSTQAGVFIGCHGYTDSLGFISGYVPANSALQINCLVPSCYYSSFEKDFTTTTANIDLGTFAVNLTQRNYYTINGTVIDCSNAPVTDGRIILIPSDYSGNISVPLTNGSFSFSPISCPNVTYSIAAIDNTNIQASTIQQLSLTPGINNIGALDVCAPGNLPNITFTIDGVSVTIIAPTYYGGISASDTTVSGGNTIITPNHLSINFRSTNGSSFSMINAPVSGVGQPYYPGIIDDYITNYPGTDDEYQPTDSTPITITYFGQIGDLIIGNFTEQMLRTSDNTTHTVTVSFKLIRTL
jgi:hypothetical protein